MFQWLLNGRFQFQDFTPNQLLGAFVEGRISSVDDIDCIGGLLKTRLSILVIILIILLVLLLFVFSKLMLLEGLPQVYALENRVLCLRVKRATPGKKLLEIIPLIPFFTKLASIHRCYGVIWLAFLVEVALTFVGA